jgi:hypothetical protein
VDIFDKLVQSSNSTSGLDSFLNTDLDELYDCLLSQNYEEVNKIKDKVESYILSSFRVIKSLDTSKETTLVFFTILLNVSERFGFLLSFQRLLSILSKFQYNFGHRLKAASLYLVGIKSDDDYLERYDEIYSKLQEAYANEEDNIDAVISTVINFYSHVVKNFGDANILIAKALRIKLEQSIRDDEYSFLNHPVIFEVFEVDLTLPQYAYLGIQNILDNFLGRNKRDLFTDSKLLLEVDTQYCSLLEECDIDFASVRQISVDQYALIPNSKRFFDGLQRGVKILTEEEELYAYMVGFGPMHFSKLNSAFSFLPQDFYAKKLDIIDWGCGQGMATVAFLDFLGSKHINASINSIQLIEPSELALKRAALHIAKFNGNEQISTINKDLDSLVDSDFDFLNLKSQVHLHLFSNILDIDLFSLSKLIELLKAKFIGNNYFVCVSPYVTDVKTNRIDRFVKSFSGNDYFEIIKSINNKKGEWPLNNNWTRVLRVFKVLIK